MKGNGELSNLGEMGGVWGGGNGHVSGGNVLGLLFLRKTRRGGRRKRRKKRWELELELELELGFPPLFWFFNFFFFFFTVFVSTSLIMCVCILWSVGLWSGWLRLDGFRIKSII